MLDKSHNVQYVISGISKPKLHLVIFKILYWLPFLLDHPIVLAPATILGRDLGRALTWPIARALALAKPVVDAIVGPVLSRMKENGGALNTCRTWWGRFYFCYSWYCSATNSCKTQFLSEKRRSCKTRRLGSTCSTSRLGAWVCGELTTDSVSVC